MRERLRALVLNRLAHPMSDDPSVSAVVLRLQSLERHHVEEVAMMHRKRSMQSSHNLRERAKAFSSFDDERETVLHQAMRTASSGAPIGVVKVVAGVFKLAPRERWIAWEAVPVKILKSLVEVAVEDPRKGFMAAEIERETGLRVQTIFAGLRSSEIVEILIRAKE